MLCDRPDVIVITDEAHRSQYDTLALNMRAALPKALFVALHRHAADRGRGADAARSSATTSRSTTSSSRSKTTRPSGSSTRTGRRSCGWRIPNLNDDIYALIEAAELDEEQEKRLERELGRQYHLITRDDRLETVAKDIVQHFLGRGLSGQGDGRLHRQGHRPADVRQGAEALAGRACTRGAGTGAAHRLRGKSDPDRVRSSQQRLDVLTTTDMAVVVSPGQNEIEQMKTLGLDIVPHRKRMNDEALDEKFKDADDPLAARVPLRDVAHRLRRAELLDDLPRQADAEPHADADHRAGEPGVPRQAQRPDRGLRERVRVAGEGAGDLRQGPGRRDPGPRQAAARRGAANGRGRRHRVLRGRTVSASPPIEAQPAGSSTG